MNGLPTPSLGDNIGDSDRRRNLLRKRAEEELKRRRSAQKPDGARQPVSRPKPPQRAAESVSQDGWVVDPKTGKRYKPLAGNDPSLVSAMNRTENRGKHVPLETLRETYSVDPDFDLDDLSKTAETFMAHLRVPPNREEMQRIIEERKQKELDNIRRTAELEKEWQAEKERFDKNEENQ